MVMQTAVASCQGDKIHSSTCAAQKRGGLWCLQAGPVHAPSLPQGGGFQVCKTGLSAVSSPPDITCR